MSLKISAQANNPTTPTDCSSKSTGKYAVTKFGRFIKKLAQAPFRRLRTVFYRPGLAKKGDQTLSSKQNAPLWSKGVCSNIKNYEKNELYNIKFKLNYTGALDLQPKPSPRQQTLRILQENWVQQPDPTLDEA